MELWRLSTGDSISRYEKCIVVNFTGKRKVLSTSLCNGGYHEDFEYVFNHDSKPNPGEKYVMSLAAYLETLKTVAHDLGYLPEKGSGMGTAAYMENVAIIEKSFKELTVTAIVTGGIETNGGRVGDPTSYHNPMDKNRKEPLGTINIMVYIDGDLNEAIMARALVTCTEAKTAALQELMAGSRYSMGIATGSGTDQTMIIANSDSPYYYDSAGKHSKLGELIGVSVKKAVKLALYKQNRLGPKQQHNIFKRIERFGITIKAIYELYKEKERPTIPKYQVLNAIERWGRSSEAVIFGAMWAHLVDEWQWELISGDEMNDGFSLIGMEKLSEVSMEHAQEGLRDHIVFKVKELLVKELEDSYETTR